MRPARLLPLLALTCSACTPPPALPRQAPPPSPPASPSALPPSPPTTTTIVGIPELVPQTGHSTAIASLAWSPAGSLLASATRPDGLRIWSPADRAARAALRTRDTDPVRIAWSPDSRSVAVANWNGTVEVWDLDRLRLTTSRHDHDGPVHSLAYTADGGLLLTGGQDAAVFVYEAGSGRVRGKIAGLPAAVHALAFSRDGSLLACASGSKVQVRRTGSWTPLLALEAHAKAVTTLAWAPGGNALASAAEDGMIVVWDAKRGVELSRAQAGAGVQELSWSSGGEWIAAGFDDGSARVWRVSDGGAVRTWASADRTSVTVSFDPGGSLLAVGSRDLEVWDVASGSKRFEAAASPRSMVVTWDRGSNRLTIAQAAPSSPAGASAVSADGHLEAIAGALPEVTLRRAKDGKELGRLAADRPLSAIAFRPDASQVAGTESDTGRIRVWEAATRKTVAVIEGPVGSRTIAYSPDGRWLAAASPESGVRVWDAATARLQLAIDQGAGSLAWHAGSKVLAVGGSPVMLVRIEDAQVVWIDAARDGAGDRAPVFTREGLFDGDVAGSLAPRFRVGGSATHCGMVSLAQLPPSYRREGLLRSLLEGKPMAPPDVAVSVRIP